VTGEARRGPIQLLDGVQGLADVIDRPVELLARVPPGLAHLPHQQAGDLLAARDHRLGEVLEAPDPVHQRHGRPSSAPGIPGPGGGIHGLEGLRGGHGGEAAQAKGLQALLRLQAHRREGLLDGPLPGTQLSIHQVLALVEGCDPEVFRNLLEAGEGDGFGRSAHGSTSCEGSLRGAEEGPWSPQEGRTQAPSPGSFWPWASC